jgi:hypothetical protein
MMHVSALSRKFQSIINFLVATADRPQKAAQSPNTQVDIAFLTV